MEEPSEEHPFLEKISDFACQLASKYSIIKLSVDRTTWTNGYEGLHKNFLDGPDRPSYLWIVLLTPKMITNLGGLSRVKNEIPVPYVDIDSPTGPAVLGRVPLPLDLDVLRKWRNFLEPVREHRTYRVELQDDYPKTPWILPEDLEPGGAWT
jgi:hypothetical protein